VCNPQLVLFLEMLLLNPQELRLIVQELFGLASDSGIAASKLRGDGGSKRLCACECLSRFCFERLLLAAQKPTEQTFPHAAPLRRFLAWS